MKFYIVIIAALVLLLKYSRSVDYLIEETLWGIADYGRCKGTPALKKQKVKSIEEAAKKYYSLLLSGRNPDDMNLYEEIPPISVLKSPIYTNLMNMILTTPYQELGSYTYKLMLCELHLNSEWVSGTFNNELGRNSEAVRCVMDMLYRIALCLRRIDVHMNCPDVCRAKSLDFCAHKPHTVGTCDSYAEQSIEGFQIDRDNNTLDGIKKWLRTVRLDIRYPTAFFENLPKFRYLEQAVYMQKLTARVPHCPCKKFYRYDKVMDGCVPAEYIGSCTGINPCANGGICVELDLDQFVCNCPPAFKGTLCELERNPCMEFEDLCGQFRCSRKLDDLTNGYICECPSGYQRKSPIDPSCEPIPPCGIQDSGDDPNQTPVAIRSNCQNRGRCIQDPDDPKLYFCACTPGFSGVNCEISAPAATWSLWSAWSTCFWPEVGEVCYKKPYAERTRSCISSIPGQKCVGPRRQIRYRGCELNSDKFEYDKQLTEFRKERLIRAHELCSYRPEETEPSPEFIAMQESLDYALNLDDFSPAGEEESPDLDVPMEMIETHSLNHNTAKSFDLIWLAGWIYAILIHVSIVIVWTYYIYQLRAR